MLKNTLINRKATIKIAKALGHLNKEVVYVGGAIISLYIDDPAAHDIRPTKDIDLTFEIATVHQLENLRQWLENNGFTQSSEDDIICRFRYDDLLVDVMSTREVGWAPSNRWFADGFKRAISHNLDEVVIHILPLPYFLASKMEAFFDRGLKDLYLSHDFEDIVYLFNYTSTLPNQVINADLDVRQYLRSRLRDMVNDPDIMAVMPGHLYFEETQARMDVIMERINQVLEDE